jgi:hypothetical protein
VHKAHAYRLLMTELEAWRALPMALLVRRIGDDPLQRIESADDGDVVIDTRATWRDAEHTAILVQSVACYCSGQWFDQRIEECITIKLDSQSKRGLRSERISGYTRDID